nr:uncharacterized protein LOC109185573 [Ipomoea trifida]
MNGSTWYSDRYSQRLGGGIHEVEQISALSAKVDNVATMVQKLAQITLQNQNGSYVYTPHSPSRQVMICDLCGGGHNLGECLNDDTNYQSSVEHINLVGYNRPQQPFQPQGAYDPNNSRNHPDFSWSNPNGAANPQSYGNRNPPPGFQGQQNFRGGPTQQFRSTQGFQPQAPTIQPSPPLPTLEAPPPPNWEAMMQMMLKSQLQSEEKYKQMSEKIDQLSAHNKMLERQIANQAFTSSTKVPGKLPACPENPREHVNAIVTRSGKKLEEPPFPVDKPRSSKILDVEIEEKLEEEEATPPVLNASPQSHEKDEKEKPERKYVPPLPFPQKFQKQAKDNAGSKGSIDGKHGKFRRRQGLLPSPPSDGSNWMQRRMGWWSSRRRRSAAMVPPSSHGGISNRRLWNSGVTLLLKQRSRYDGMIGEREQSSERL